ncbi:S41 family peptidase [Chitinimonas koreensis]|uniref:S41 family peptidase n=1 Tax=Chitinimonas koreensis TaxID=356302 RepID=UPI000415BA70|nr:S41 family peptidase [Chitinimonas koreensis]QNM96595.1 S41 family peptidase [Chitinimonas koreensis]
MFAGSIQKNAVAGALCALGLWLAAAPAAAEGPAAGQKLDAAARGAVLDALATQIAANYVFPEQTGKTIAAVKAKAARGGYDQATTSEAFAAILTEDLRQLARDKHFGVEFDPEFRSEGGPAAAPSAAQLAEERKDAAGRAWGIARVERLAGNVGYLDLRGFPSAYLVGTAYQSALSLLAGTDALILDLRRNGGGDPAGVSLLLSHFFAEGDERHLNDIYNRPTNTTRAYWTHGVAGPRYTRPVYVLTSAQTFSGGEECAYDLQTQKRAILVGETTGGGANPVDAFGLPHGFVAIVPTGRAINPVTGTNWEHVGVKPDVAVPADKALETAWRAALDKLLKESTDPEIKEGLQRTLARLDKGEAELPAYRPARR